MCAPLADTPLLCVNAPPTRTRQCPPHLLAQLLTDAQACSFCIKTRISNDSTALILSWWLKHSPYLKICGLPDEVICDFVSLLPALIYTFVKTCLKTERDLIFKERGLISF